MSTDRTVALWESPYNLQKLPSNGFSYCIAKSVIDTSGSSTFNLVWQSLALAPRATVTWTVQYSLNWTIDIPSGNAQVTIGGDWQACNPGQVFDIDKNGLFQPSTVASNPGFLKIGKNNYKYDGASGIHIVVGVQTSANDFQPVYVDTTELGLNMSAWYQPQEKAQWWYEKGTKSATMITGAGTTVCNYDLTQPNPSTNTYYVSTTYDYDSGAWSTSLQPPPNVKLTGLLGAERKRGDDFDHNLNDADLDKVQKDVKRILKILHEISGKGPVQDLDPSIYQGFLVFLSVAACTHGTGIIVQKLISAGYIVTLSIAVSGVTAAIKIERPRNSQDRLITDGVVPPQVVEDWDAAVAAASADHPINNGIQPDPAS